MITLALACQDPVKLGRCGSQCYQGPPATTGVGLCRAGVVTCDPEGQTTGCNDQGPAQEVCDGQDQDCDGQVDNASADEGSFCGPQLGACAGNRTTCRAGHLECPAPGSEVCDGSDNDCDGEIDEVPAQLCYDADARTALHPPCHPGLKLCIGGQWACFGQQLPAPTDYCGDGVDDDCDGLSDNVPRDQQPLIDVVFVVDQSGSMCDDLDRIRNAIEHLVALPLPLQVWLIDLPGGRNAPEANPICHPGRDLSRPCRDLGRALANLRCDLGDLEPSLDVMLWIAGPAGVGWRSGSSRFLVLLTDEPAQTLSTVTADQAGDALKTSGIVPLIYGDEDLLSFADTTYGRGYLASIHSVDLAADLTHQLSQECE